MIMFHTSQGIINKLYRRGIQKALLVTEKKEEKEEEVDLLFAEDEEEEEEDVPKEENIENFTPVCTPTKNRKNLLGFSNSISCFRQSVNHVSACDEGEWDSDWDEENNDSHPNIIKEREMMYV